MVPRYLGIILKIFVRLAMGTSWTVMEAVLFPEKMPEIPLPLLPMTDCTVYHLWLSKQKRLDPSPSFSSSPPGACRGGYGRRFA